MGQGGWNGLVCVKTQGAGELHVVQLLRLELLPNDSYDHHQLGMQRLLAISGCGQLAGLLDCSVQ